VINEINQINEINKIEEINQIVKLQGLTTFPVPIIPINMNLQLIDKNN
jgi:hypothetical protein